MESHNDTRKYSLHSQEARNHLYHNKGKILGDLSPSVVNYSRGFSPLISACCLHIKDHASTPSPAPSGDVALSFAEPEECKKVETVAHPEDFVSQALQLQVAAFEKLVHAVDADYLDGKLQQKDVVQDYMAHYNSAEKYRRMAAYIKTQEKCGKEQADYRKNAKNATRTFPHSTRVEHHTLIIGFEEILACVSASSQDNFDAELPIGDAALDLGFVFQVSDTRL